MGTPATIPPIDAVNPLGNQNSLLLSLTGVLCGYPIVVDSDNNLFLKRPEDLAENAWHLLHSDQSTHPETAWKPKGEARQIVLDLPISCWEITHEFHETDNQNTNWMMLEYKIIVANESFSICRIRQDPASHVGSSIPSDNNHQRSVDDCPVKCPADVDTSSGDYLELLDLEVPLFPSSTLENLS